MINDQLVAYIKQQLATNVSKDIIISNLKSAGWDDTDVAEAFNAINPPANPVPVSAPVPVVPPASFIPPTVYPINPNMSSGSMVEPKVHHTSNIKKISLVVFILVLLGVAGGGAYAYYTGAFVTLPSLLTQSITNGKSIKTANYNATINVDFSGVKDAMTGFNQLIPGGLNSTQLTFTAKGSFDTTDTNNIKLSNAFSFDVGSLSVAAEIRLLDNMFYGDLTKVPVAFAVFVPNLASYENKWYSFPYKNTGDELNANPLTGASGISSNIFSKLTEEQKDAIYKITSSAHLITTVKKLPVETISGDASYHFQFDLDRAGIVAYFQSLKDYVHSIGKDDSSLSAYDPTSFAKSLDQVKDFQGEIWIGKNDKFIHKLSLNFSIQPDMTKPDKVKLTIVSIASGWNQPVSIVAPADSTPFSDLMASATASAQSQENEATIKANLSSMRAQAELFYNAHSKVYSGLCSSSQILASQKTAEKAGATKFLCQASSQKYIISTKMPTSVGYFCVDSNGTSLPIASAPTTTSCPQK